MRWCSCLLILSLMSLSHIISQRLVSHWLVGKWFSSPYDLVQHMWAVQAQDIPQATRVLGSRIPGSTKETIKSALSKGSIVRTWPMRGTLHYLAPENVHRMLDLCASKTLSWFAKRREFLWISDKHADKALHIMESALRWWKNLTRSALWKVLQEWWIPMQAQRVYHLPCFAATSKLICFGPPIEKEETFVLLDERVPKHKILTHDEQLANLANMYITGHGPATVDDLARWCGLGKTECKKAISLIADECEIIDYQGKIYYYKLAQKKVSSNCVRLLWWFDEYFLWYKDRSIVADIQHHGKLFTTNGIFFPLIIADGKAVGSWKRAWKKWGVDIALSPLEGVRLPLKDIHKEAEHYAQFRWVDKVHIDT
jgi:hypothetical protein